MPTTYSRSSAETASKEMGRCPNSKFTVKFREIVTFAQSQPMCLRRDWKPGPLDFRGSLVLELQKKASALLSL